MQALGVLAGQVDNHRLQCFLELVFGHILRAEIANTFCVRTEKTTCTLVPSLQAIWRRKTGRKLGFGKAFPP